MGFRFRKSFKIAPGVKLNVNKKSVGVSVGGKGARVSVNSSGKVTKSVSIPGTGLSYTDTDQIGKKKNKVKSTTEPPQPPVNNNNSSSSGDNNQPPKKDNTIEAIALLLVLAGFIYWGNILVRILLFVVGCIFFNVLGIQNGNTKPFYKKPWQIILAVLFVYVISRGAFKNNIDEITLKTDLSTALQVPTEQTVVFNYEPADADNADDIKLHITDTSILAGEIKSNEDGKVTCILTPKAEGSVYVTCSDGDDVRKQVKVNISTSELEAKETAEKKAEEERLAAEKAEQERLAAEQKAAEEKAAQEQAAAEQAAQEQAAQEQQQEQMVYITPSGERYHLDASCGGKNSYQVPISQIGGRTPCKKCAGG